MKGTRLRILQLLQRNKSDTVDGLANAIGLAPATIRRHLDILQRDRLIDFEEVRKRTGRPQYSFYLTEVGQEALPKAYDQLLEMIVSELPALDIEKTRGRDGQQILESVFKQLADGVAKSYEDELAGKDLGQRLATLTTHLEQKDFSPEVEISEGTLRILLLNCPYRSAALRNKAVCTFDHNLISSLLDLQVEQQQSIHGGDNGCIYSAALVSWL